MGIKIGIYVLFLMCTILVAKSSGYLTRAQYDNITSTREITVEDVLSPSDYHVFKSGIEGPPWALASRSFATLGDRCNLKLYEKYYRPVRQDILSSQINFQVEEFLYDGLVGTKFSWTDVCYHSMNTLYCSEHEICKCREFNPNEEEDPTGLKEAKEESYDPLTLKWYKFCRIQEGFRCDGSQEIIVCDEGLHCENDENYDGKCVKSSERYLKGNSAMIIATLPATIVAVITFCSVQ